MDQGLGRGGEFWQQFGCVRGRSYRGPSLSVVSSFSIASVFGRIESCVHVPVGGGPIRGLGLDGGLSWGRVEQDRKRAWRFPESGFLFTNSPLVDCEV